MITGIWHETTRPKEPLLNDRPELLVLEHRLSEKRLPEID